MRRALSFPLLRSNKFPDAVETKKTFPATAGLASARNQDALDFAISEQVIAERFPEAEGGSHVGDISIFGTGRCNARAFVQSLTSVLREKYIVK